MEKELNVIYRQSVADDYTLLGFSSNEEAKEFYELNKHTCYYMGLIEIIEETFEQ